MTRIVIPVRQGSKSIPKKNEQVIGDKSLLAWSIEACLSTSAEEIIVSTDGSDLEAIASRYPVRIHRRSRATSTDEASTESALLEVISEFSIEPSSVLGFVQATSPFLTSNSIEKCLTIAQSGGVGFTASDQNIFMWALEADQWTPIGHPANFRPNRQQRTPHVVETGGCYAFPVALFLQEGYRFCGKPSPVLVDTFEGIDIDSVEDLEIARLLHTRSRFREFTKSSLDIKLVICDFDGCLTDNRVITDELGRESVASSRSDGLYIHILLNRGIEVLILSSEKNQVVQQRAKKLGISAITGVASKLLTASEIVRQRQLDWAQVCFIGNDINDLEAMNACGLAMCPIDAAEKIRNNADIVLPERGGEGIFRSVVEILGGVGL